MSIAGQVPLLACLAACAVAVAGCQSTQSKSAEIAAELGPVKERKGLKITKESKDVKVLDTTLLSAGRENAVVVEVKNETDQTLTDIPIAINVLDAKGKSVFKNDLPGLERALNHIPILKPGETLDWVNNQVLAIGKPDSVKVEVGADAVPLSTPIPDIEVSEPKLENDSVTGLNAAGTATNKSGERQERLLLYGVAKQGDKVVAAGRAAIEKMNPDRNRAYHIFFVGDPEGADIEVSYFPTLETSGNENGGG